MTALFAIAGHLDQHDVLWQIGSLDEANPLLAREHYLGPMSSGANLVIVGERAGKVVAAQVWRHPTSRNLPSEGRWLELSRWCLTPAAGKNAGSRQHRYAVRLIREHRPRVTTLVSYSDPSQGHTGALYRACNWEWAPTWLRLRPPPSGQGDWGTGMQAVKDRWIYPVRKDPSRPAAIRIDDASAIRHWRKAATPEELRWARSHPDLEGISA